MKLFQKIKFARKSKGWRQSDLSKNSGVSLDTIKRYESSKAHSNPTLGNLKKIALATETDIDFFISNIHEANEKSTADLINIPVFDLSVSAGNGVINNEDDAINHIELENIFLKKIFKLTTTKDLFIVNSNGDSMLPTIPNNCQLLVQKREAKENQICIFRVGDEYYVKRLQKRPKYKLISDNKDYDPIVLEGEDFEFLGIVVGEFKTF